MFFCLTFGVHITFLHFTHLFFEIPGPLTLDQLLEDPMQVSTGVNLPFSMGPNILRDKPYRQIDIYVLLTRQESI